MMMILMMMWDSRAGISFLESWVKFRADLVTRVVGLDVGRNVFHALNRVEIVLALAGFLLTVLDLVVHFPSTRSLALLLRCCCCD
jgi:hypothetical protein